MSNEQLISITVRLYSILRERNGRIVDRLELELPQGSCAEDALRQLDVPRDLDVVLSLNDQIAAETAVLHDGDHLAIIPAIAGGGSIVICC